jgi:hypothetical protein
LLTKKNLMENYLAKIGNNAKTPKQRETSAKPPPPPPPPPSFFFLMGQNKKEHLIDIEELTFPSQWLQ